MVKRIQLNVSDDLMSKVDEYRKVKFMSQEDYAIDAMRTRVLASVAARSAPSKKLVLEDIYSRPTKASAKIEGVKK